MATKSDTIAASPVEPPSARWIVGDAQDSRENLRHDSELCRNLNIEPLEYQAEVLLTSEKRRLENTTGKVTNNCNVFKEDCLLFIGYSTCHLRKFLCLMI